MSIDGFRLAITTFTVAPIAGPARIDRSVAAWAMRFAPLVGLLLGTVLAGLLWATRLAGMPGVLAAGLTVAAAALLTRGMHLDGLADTVDALGSYRDREKALAIMRSPEVGPFGVVALVFAVLLPTAAINFVTPLELVVAVATGRLAAALGCQRGTPAARPEGLGALVAGTVGPVALAVNALAIGVLAFWASSWQGPIAVAAALAVVLFLRRHLVRRLGGVTGDVLGFLVEVASVVALIGLCVGALELR